MTTSTITTTGGGKAHIIAASEEPMFSPGQIKEISLQEMPIFQLLKAFKLQ
jgi:hypothetical protein